jgi:hypothetical protein
MWEKYERGDCVDLSQCARDPDGYYILERFEVGKDYCDLHAEAWIWSIGRRRSDGQILASTGSRLYQNPDFECLFLR